MTTKTARIVAGLSMLGLLGLIPIMARAQTPYQGYILDQMAIRSQQAAQEEYEANMRTARNAEKAAAQKTAAQKHRGQAVIRQRRATTRFATRRLPIALWIDRTAGRDAALRRQHAAEVKLQLQIWNDEARARRAQPNDIGHVLGLAFVLGYEAHSGRRANVQQFKNLVNDFRRYFIKDPWFQGMSVVEKQQFAESEMLSATDAVRQTRQASRTGDSKMLAQGRKQGTNYINRWWTGGIANFVVTPTKFVNSKR